VVRQGKITFKGDSEGNNLSERGTTVPAILTPVRGGKLRRRVDVPNKMDSDLPLLRPSPL